MKENFHIYTLSNGLRCIHSRQKSDVARCAIIVNMGSRDELKGEHALAHFTEHAFFKGTVHRKAYQVNCRLENLGGELNAFTTKEDTTVHATVRKSDFPKALDLLRDVMFFSTFPENEIVKERDVIADEINMYRDTPADLIYDEAEDILFAGSELGHNILGTKNDLRHIGHANILKFYQRGYTLDQMVICSLGDFSPKHIEALMERYFSEFSTSARDFQREVPPINPLFDIRRSRHTHQTHAMLCSRAYSLDDDRRIPFSLLNNILGGPSANSRLNLILREKYGLTYSVESSYTAYSDSGFAGIYFSSDRHDSQRCLEIIDTLLEELTQKPLSSRQLSMAKKQFMAQMAISQEGREGYMLSLGKSLLVHDQIEKMDQIYEKISSITAQQILDVARDVWGKHSLLMYV